MGFEWDEIKAERNLRAHGVDFDEAATTFYDPLALVRSDEEHSRTKERCILLGRSQHRLVVTIFAEREASIRIISSRRATRREVKAYEEGV